MARQAVSDLNPEAWYARGYYEGQPFIEAGIEITARVDRHDPVAVLDALACKLRAALADVVALREEADRV